MPEIIPLDMPAAYWRGKAQQAQRNGETLEALRFYQAALRKQPDADTRRALAEAYAALYCFGSSDWLYLQNLAEDALDADSVFGLARNRSLSGDSAGMAALLDLYLRLAPCGEAADNARDILWQQPREPKPGKRMHRARVLLAQAQDHEEQPEKCLKLLRRAWKHGKSAQAAQLLAGTLLKLEQYDEAFQFAGRACRMQPDDLHSRLLLATSLRHLGLARGCRAALEQAAPLCESLEQISLFCESAVRLEQGEMAIRLLHQQLEKHPASVELLLLLAMALHDSDAPPEQVIKPLERAIALDGEHPMPRFLLEAAQRDAQQEGEAEQAPGQISIDIPFDPELTEGEDADEFYRKTEQLLRLPMLGMADIALGLYIAAGDERGMRLALLTNEISPVLRRVALENLTQAHVLPLMVREEGGLSLYPPRPMGEYDADLHDVIHRLLRMERELSLKTLIRELPEAWYSLSPRTRRRCAKRRDSEWLYIFAAYLLLLDEAPQRAGMWLMKSKCRRHALRAWKRLLHKRGML